MKHGQKGSTAEVAARAEEQPFRLRPSAPGSLCPPWLMLLAVLGVVAGAAGAMETEFTYQGQLRRAGAPANGSHDFEFRLYDAETGGGQVASTVAKNGVQVTNGLFTVKLDFGAAAFDGNPRWVEITVGAGGGGTFTTLSPRQGLTPTPYSLCSQTIVDGAVTAAKLADGAVTAAKLAPNTAWLTTGNAGTKPGTHFVGTTDNQPLELRIGGTRVLRMEGPGADGAAVPNMIGGSCGNSVSAGVTGATIAGGGMPWGWENNVLGNWGAIGGGTCNEAGDRATVAGGWKNNASAYCGFVGGGEQNTANGSSAVVGGGIYNTASGQWATVGGGNSNQGSGYLGTIAGGSGNAASGGAATAAGGEGNTASNNWATVSGGRLNTASGSQASVGGGGVNLAEGRCATVPGGYANSAAGDFSWAGGCRARAHTSGGTRHDGAFVWADYADVDFYSTAANEFSARARGGVRFVTTIDGSGNPAAGVKVAAGGSSWSSISDRSAKKNFAPINGDEVLAKVATMPVTYWQYKWDDDNAVALIGPVAQDFIGAFYPGADDKCISTQQADGVHFAAIKALERRTADLTEENASLRAENAQLKARLDHLEAQVRGLMEAVALAASRDGR